MHWRIIAFAAFVFDNFSKSLSRENEAFIKTKNLIPLYNKYFR